MVYPNHTLHLYKQQPLKPIPPWYSPTPASKGIYHETTKSASPRHSVLSNYPSNPLARSVAKISSGKAPMKTHTTQGEVTLTGLRRGYIQASPFYPTNSLSISYKEDRIVVSGYKADGAIIFKVFSKLSDARKYLYTTH